LKSSDLSPGGLIQIATHQLRWTRQGKTSYIFSMKLLQCKGYDDPKKITTVHTILFLPELTLLFDDTVKHVLIAGGTPLGKSEGY
jgi:hypothetical protein